MEKKRFFSGLYKVDDTNMYTRLEIPKKKKGGWHDGTIFNGNTEDANPGKISYANFPVSSVDDE